MTSQQMLRDVIEAQEHDLTDMSGQVMPIGDLFVGMMNVRAGLFITYGLLRVAEAIDRYGKESTSNG